MKELLEGLRLIILFLAQLSAVLMAISKIANKLKRMLGWPKPAKAKKHAAPSNAISAQETTAQNRHRAFWFRMACSVIALSVLIFYQVSPFRYQPITTGGVALLVMVGALYVVTMLDRS